MKRKYVLAGCIISALLIMFSFPVMADEIPEVDAGASSNSAPLLDSYFWDNYTLLPYIESTGGTYLNTGISVNPNLVTHLKFGSIETTQGYYPLFGYRYDSNYDRYYVNVNVSLDRVFFDFSNSEYNYLYEMNYNNIYDIKLGKDVYLNNELIHTFTNNTFEHPGEIYIFNCNSNGTPLAISRYKLYHFSIYDNSLTDPNDQESDAVGYVRYYYPARSKSSNVVGLYDAVSKTFITSIGSNQFTMPDGSDASMGITANIVNFIGAGLGWIGDILTYAISEPLILIFMAIGLAGATFRWARRLYHF